MCSKFRVHCVTQFSGAGVTIRGTVWDQLWLLHTDRGGGEIGPHFLPRTVQMD